MIDTYDVFNQLLLKHNITAYRVSKDTGISQVTLCDWKHGRSKPKTDKMLTLANYFDVSLNYMLGKEE